MSPKRSDEFRNEVVRVALSSSLATNRLNNRAESSHVPIRRRERKMQRFKSHKSSQIFLSVYGSIYNLFNTQRHLISRQILRAYRSISMAEWNIVTCAD